MNTITKTCSDCGESKPLSEFYERGGQCRACKQLACKAWYAQNREKKNALSRAWSKDNPERANALAVARYHADPEHYRACARQRYAKKKAALK